MSSNKRAAGQELNHDNWNEEDKKVEAGEFKKASEDDLQNRVIKSANRSFGEVSASTELEESAQNRLVKETSKDKDNENHYDYSSNGNFAVNKFGVNGEQFSQQNYSCFTPTKYSLSSYMTAGETVPTHSLTTQSVNYHPTPEVVSSYKSSINENHSSSDSYDSPCRQPHSIPTYSAAINSTSMKSNETLSTHSQKSIASITSAPVPATENNQEDTINFAINDSETALDLSSTSA